jgi:hypothetical protein
MHPLAASLALVFGASCAVADTLAAPLVQNCSDHGAGSLRQAIIDNTSSAPIDLTHLSCSRITLTSGAIQVQRAQLISGPGAALLEIDGAHLDRVFVQTAPQLLALYGMTVQNGYTGSLGGGCVYSAGPLQLNDAVIRNCSINATSGTTRGGGVLVHGTFMATHSSIVDNQNYSALGAAYGGGVFVDNPAVLDHSTISRNLVSGSSAAAGGIDVVGMLTMGYSTVADNRSAGKAGGVYVFGGAAIKHSTISGNSAVAYAGGIELHGPTPPKTIVDSTISGNVAGFIGGVYAEMGDTSISNSTIAFNVETESSSGGGLRISHSNVTLQSTIIAANRSAGGFVQNISLGAASSVGGANNLIGPAPPIVPADAVVDPMLLPLHDNGGATRTHALRPGSPAVGAGNAVSGETTDQRGTGFPRVIGAAADIGAFEGVDANSIFFDGFD